MLLRRLLPVLLLASFAFTQENSQPLTIEKIFAEGGLTGRMPESIQWSPDGTKLSYVLRSDNGEHGQLCYVDMTTGKPAVLVSEAKLQTLSAPTSKLKSEREKERRERYRVAAYHWAPDSKHLLFDSNGQLWLYSLETQTGIPFTGSPEATGDPKFSSDGKLTSYIKNHNIFVRTIDGKRETQLTRSSDENILNGEVDWVYAEELEVRSNYFWSPDSRRILFMQMNEKGVPAYPIEDFLPTHPSVDQQKYPQPGDQNPTVRLGVVSSGGSNVRWLRLPEQKVDEEIAPASPIGSSSDFYVPRFGWVNDRVVYAEVLNRAQDEIKLYFIDAGSGRTQLMLDEKDDTWLDVNDDFWLISVAGSGAGQASPSPVSASFPPNQFLWGSWRDGFTHLYLYSFDGQSPLAHAAKLERQLTHGNFEVLSASGAGSGVNAVIGQTVYFTSNQSDDRQRQLYSVSLNGGEPQQLSREQGSHDTVFPDQAPTGGNIYYADTYSARDTPPKLLFCKVGGDCSTVWESRSIAAYNLPQPRFVDFKAEDGTVLHGEIFLPPGNSAPGSVPLLNSPYGGPHAQSVADKWGSPAAGAHTIFSEMLAAQGIATLTVDNRGMGARGKKFAATLRRNFGEVELRDQLAAVDQALEKFPELDGKRMGWYGWSYGGYMTLYALTHSDRFRAGVAGAPVTDWRLYDSIYTERYMGLPQQNAAAYTRTSPVSTAAGLHGDLLIVHGTGDDNVHFANTIQMVQALLEAGKQFDLMLLPGKTHASLGGVINTDLYSRIHDHFMRTLMPAK